MSTLRVWKNSLVNIQRIMAFVFLIAPGSGGGTMSVRGVEVVWREPKAWSADSLIMVLFGGRNWPGEKTLKMYTFDAPLTAVILVVDDDKNNARRPATGAAAAL